MHRQTINSYDAGAAWWRRTRRSTPDETELPAAAAAFRERVGRGLILDLGCGPGGALPFLGPPVVGLDASLGMLALVQNGPLVAADIEALPIVRGSVAGAFASFSFQHLPRPQFLVALRQVAAALQARGFVELWMHAAAGTDGVRENDDMGIGRWFTYWSRAELEAALPSCGFEVVEIEDRGLARRTLGRVTS